MMIISSSLYVAIFDHMTNYPYYYYIFILSVYDFHLQFTIRRHLWSQDNPYYYYISILSVYDNDHLQFTIRRHLWSHDQLSLFLLYRYSVCVWWSSPVYCTPPSLVTWQQLSTTWHRRRPSIMKCWMLSGNKTFYHFDENLFLG